MFPISQIRHSDSELVFAITAPLGADVDRVCQGLEVALKHFNYKVESIRVIELLKQFDGYLENEPLTADKKIENRMNAGDTFRGDLDLDEALAFLAVSKILAFRKSTTGKRDKVVPRQAYLFRSLKRPEEVTALRRIYGSNLVVVGVHSSRETRVRNLAERIATTYFSAQSENFRHRAEELILRDESDERKKHGQRLRKAFATADLFLDSSDAQIIARDWERFLNVLFGKPVVTPNKDELGMAYAHTAAMRSAELGRQVGAAIVDPRGNLIAVGTNEVPKAHGGYYWDGDSSDGRDWARGFDSSDHFKKANLGEFLKVLAEKEYLSEGLNKLPISDLIDKLSPFITQTRIMQLIEFIRAVHAELGALVDAAARGVPVSGCTMYVTTFPCHECARNIVAAGIARVVYIEPYSKSMALELHSNAIQLDNDTDSNKIPFLPFLGVAPRNYSNIFETADRKDEGGDGRLIDWDASTANPRVSGSFWSYTKYEQDDLEILAEALRVRGLSLPST